MSPEHWEGVSSALGDQKTYFEPEEPEISDFSSRTVEFTISRYHIRIPRIKLRSSANFHPVMTIQLLEITDFLKNVSSSQEF